MIDTEPAEVLLVGKNREADQRVIQAAGPACTILSSCLDVLVRMSRHSTAVIVLSLTEIEGQEEAALEALKDGIGNPEILLTLPSRRAECTSRFTSLGVAETLIEPYFPEDLIGAVERLLFQRRQREEGRLATGVSPSLGGEALAALFTDVADMFREVANLDQLVEVMIQVFRRRTGARRASLLFYDRKEDELVIRKAVGLPPGVPVQTRMRLGSGLAGQAAREGRPLLVKDTREEPWRAVTNRGMYETNSCISLPLLSEENLLAVLNLADKEDGSSFTEQDLTVLSLLAAQAAQTLANALRVRRIKALSIIDDLTGLYNRRHFRRTLEREFRRAVRYERPLTLAILDVDHFKVYNDVNGHEAGNRALRRIGQILSSSFRTTDSVCRYGGEEFAVILPETDKGMSFVPETEDAEHGAFRFIERVRTRIETTRFENEAALPGGCLTISGGVSSYPADASTLEDLLESADRSLYLAKAEGRNRIHIA